MNIRGIAEIICGFLLVFLGILFFFGFGIDIWDLLTDAIFVAFGVMLLRRGYYDLTGIQNTKIARNNESSSKAASSNMRDTGKARNKAKKKQVQSG